MRFEPSEIEIEGGDGFEKTAIVSAELAKNCLNAGLWELLLFTKEGGALFRLRVRRVHVTQIHQQFGCCLRGVICAHIANATLVPGYRRTIIGYNGAVMTDGKTKWESAP